MNKNLIKVVGAGLFIILAIMTAYNAFLLYAPLTDVVAFHGGTFTFSVNSVYMWETLMQVGLIGMLAVGCTMIEFAIECYR